MGTATVDLPDPLESLAPADGGVAPPVPPGGADELLSQLASSEIDRLLADADIQPSPAVATPAAVEPPVVAIPAPVGEPPAVASATASAAPTLKDIDEAGARALDSLFQQIQREEAPTASPAPASATPSAPTPAAPSDPQLATQLDALFTGLSKDKGDETTSSERSALNADLGGEPSPDEILAKDVLAAQVLIDQAPALPAAETPLAESDEDSEGPAPFYVRLLEFLNAPLAGCSESTREALGKVAIVTLVNAIAVLAYVLIFRK